MGSYPRSEFEDRYAAMWHALNLEREHWNTEHGTNLACGPARPDTVPQCCDQPAAYVTAKADAVAYACRECGESIIVPR